VLADTAGLRDSDDVIEQEGLRRALRRAEEAEIRIFVFDARYPDQVQGAAAWPGPDTILVANKIDLVPARRQSPQGRANTVMPGLDPGIHGAAITSVAAVAEGVDGRDTPGHDDKRLRSRRQPEYFPSPAGPLPEDAMPISALTGDGIDTLLSALGEQVAQTYRIEAPVLTRARHRQALEDAALSLRRALDATLPELRAEDLRLALRSFGHITGTVDVEDLLDVIFRDFCIGK
jgi:tRNA modification GTPase